MSPERRFDEDSVTSRLQLRNRFPLPCTGAPLVVRDKVVVGIAGGEFANRGFIDAYDPASGQRLWRFYTIPAPGEPASETW